MRQLDAQKRRRIGRHRPHQCGPKPRIKRPEPSIPIDPPDCARNGITPAFRRAL